MDIVVYIFVGIALMYSLPFLAVLVVARISWWSSAERKGAELLRTVLTDEQYCQLKQLGYLDIPSPSNPELIYRVPRDLGRVQMIENECIKASLCLQTSGGWIPDADMVVIHTLMIQADEDSYLQQANRFIAVDGNT